MKSQVLGNTLLPQTMYRRRTQFYDAVMKEQHDPTQLLTVEAEVKHGLTQIPVYRRERSTVSSYTYLRDREWLEGSTFHKMQIVGRTKTSQVSLRMPKMKANFESKASIQRKLDGQTQGGISPQIGYRRGNFFDPVSQVKKDREREKDRDRASNDARNTNTLSYSETVGGNTITISGVGRKTATSDLGTVFGQTTRFNNGFDNGENGIEEMQESARFGGGENSNNGTQQLDVSVQKSEFIDDKEQADNFATRMLKVPELHNVWFQFFTDTIYCMISSLVLTINNINYAIPFDMTKGVLASAKNFEGFIKSTQFNDDGTFEVDGVYMERIKGSRTDASTYVRNDETLIDGVYVRIRYDTTNIRQPFACIYIRENNRWIERQLDYRELRSIDSDLQFAELVWWI